MLQLCKSLIAAHKEHLDDIGPLDLQFPSTVITPALVASCARTALSTVHAACGEGSGDPRRLALCAALIEREALRIHAENPVDLTIATANPHVDFAAAFALHEAAFNAVRGDPSQPLPADITWRTERALNDPDCQDASTPDRCAATAGSGSSV